MFVQMFLFGTRFYFFFLELKAEVLGSVVYSQIGTVLATRPFLSDSTVKKTYNVRFARVFSLVGTVELCKIDYNSGWF